MKQRILKRLFLFLLFFFTWLDLTKFTAIPISKIGEPIPIFPQIQINLLQAKNKSLVNDALQETSKMLLRYFVPQLAHEPWQTNFYFVDLLQEKDVEVIVTLSLPPDKGILVLLQKRDNHYFIISFQNQLFPLTKVEVRSLKNGEKLLLTKENQQKQLASLGNSTPVKIWRWDKNNLQEIFTENTTQEIDWQNTWQNSPLKPSKWYNLKQNLTITISQDHEHVTIKTRGKQQISEAPVKKTGFPAPYDVPSPYTILQTRDILQEYYWDQQWEKFIIKTGFHLPPGQNVPEEVAILKDFSQDLASLAFTKQQQYQVINKKGEIFPLNKSSLIN